MTTLHITPDGEDTPTLWAGDTALLRQPGTDPQVWAMVALVVELGGPERVRALAGTRIETSDDLGLLHEGLSESGWGSIAAESQSGQPFILWEFEDGELYATDGSSEDGSKIDVVPAEQFLPFTVVGKQGGDALARFREVGTR